MRLFHLFVAVCILSYNVINGRKSFKNRDGDIYDCVDFYKQPAFNHPMLANHNFHPLMRPEFSAQSLKIYTPAQKMKVKREGCKVGFVPIRRLTNGASKMDSKVIINEPSGTYYAGVRTKADSTRYGGGGAIFSVWNPSFVQISSYSQARLKVSNGPDAIQVGWRVDPSLRGDNRTRQFIYTDAGQSHCFDAQCGFVIVNNLYQIGEILKPVSQPGKTIHGTVFNITKDRLSGNWWFIEGAGIEIGFWPKEIFTGLRDFALDVEWAGEVYSPPGINEPPMGSGYKPEVFDGEYVAFFGNITTVTENYISIDAGDLEEVATDRSLYDVEDKGKLPPYNRLVFYGGARY